MLQNAPRASEGKIIKLVHSVPNGRARLLHGAAKFPNRWPFTVSVPYGAMLLAGDRLLVPTDNGSFVT